MKKTTKMLVLLAVITQILLLSTGCAKNSSTGKYCRDFGGYILTSAYIELKNDKTYETDGTDPNLFSQGTYEISGSDITFTHELDSDLAFFFGFSDTTLTTTGKISGGVITVEGITYRK